jgi:transcriptional regulator with GAF, ATPase, and Fis domain
MVQQLSIGAEPDAQATQLTLGRLTRTVASLFDSAAVALAQLDPDSGDLITQSVAGFVAGSSRPTRIALGGGLEGWVAAHQSPILIEDTSRDSRFAPEDVKPLRSVLCAPLLKNDRLLGTLLIGSVRPGAYNAHQREVFLAVAAILGDVLNAFAQLGTARARARPQKVLLDTARSLAGSLDGGQVFGATLSGLRRVTGSDAALVYWLEAREDVLRPMAEVGTRFAGLLRGRVPVSDEGSLAAWVARHRRARMLVPGEEDVALLETRAVQPTLREQRHGQ